MPEPGKFPPAAAEAAQALALGIVEFIARQEGLLETFLGASGLSAQGLHDRLDEPETLAAVVDFLLLDDRWVLAFAADAGIDPALVARLRALLPGGDLPHWT